MKRKTCLIFGILFVLVAVSWYFISGVSLTKSHVSYAQKGTILSAASAQCLSCKAKQKYKSSILFYTSYLNATEKYYSGCCGISQSTFDHSQFHLFEGGTDKLYEARMSHLLRSIAKHDIVVFHVKDMPGPRLLKQVSRRRPRDQLWAYYNKESPYQTINLRTGKYDSIFNVTVTPLRHSDVTSSYGYFYKKLNPLDSWLKFSSLGIIYTKNGKRKSSHLSFPYSKAKKGNTALLRKKLLDTQTKFIEKKLVTWVVSQCGRPRDRYARELSKYIPIDIFGKCSSKFGQLRKCVKNSFDCELRLRGYKFSLAFENSFCNDYITEKYWDALLRGSVPIVLGGENYEENVIPGSYINVRSFSNAKLLAAYIMKLSQNKQKYQKYQRWRENYVLDYTPGDPHRLQYIVQKLHVVLGQQTRESYDLSKFYSVRNNCPLEINDTQWKS